MYAIIAAGGKQYKVTNGDVVKFEKLEGNVGDKVVFDQVLLVSEKKVTIGDPLVANATVEGEITAQGKDKKIIVYKYKSKTGYHKKNGHRQPVTSVKIEKVILNGVELEPEKVEEKKTEKKKAPKKTKEKKPASKKEKVEKTVEKEVEEVKEEVITETETETVSEAVEEKIDAGEAVEEAKEALEDAKEAITDATEDASEEIAEEEAKETEE